MIKRPFPVISPLNAIRDNILDAWKINEPSYSAILSARLRCKLASITMILDVVSLPDTPKKYFNALDSSPGPVGILTCPKIHNPLYSYGVKRHEGG